MNKGVSIRQNRQGHWNDYKVIIKADYTCHREMTDYYEHKNKAIDFISIFLNKPYILECNFYYKIEEIIFYFETEKYEIENGMLLNFEYFIKTE